MGREQGQQPARGEFRACSELGLVAHGGENRRPDHCPGRRLTHARELHPDGVPDAGAEGGKGALPQHDLIRASRWAPAHRDGRHGVARSSLSAASMPGPPLSS